MACLYLRESQYLGYVECAKQTLMQTAQPSRPEVSGSLARGELEPPYSDLDLLVIVAVDQGRNMRDLIPQIAATTGELLTIFVDPFCPRGTFCSIYSGPLEELVVATLTHLPAPRQRLAIKIQNAILQDSQSTS